MPVQGIVLPSASAQKRFLGLGQEEFEALSTKPIGMTDLLSRRACSTFGATFGLAQWTNLLESSGKELRIQTWYSLSAPDRVINEEHVLGGEMPALRERVTIIALDMVRKCLLDVGGTT